MKILRFSFLLLVFALAIASCKKTEETPPPTPNEVAGEKLTAKEWQGDSVKVKSNSALLPTPIDQQLPFTGAKLNFKTDKTFTISLGTGATEQSGTWEVLEDGKKIKLTGGFQTAFEDFVKQLVNIGGMLPAGTTFTSIKLPETFALKTLTDTKLAMNGDVTVNLAVQAGPVTLPIAIPVNTEMSFKR
jgi:hypothetical protein